MEDADGRDGVVLGLGGLKLSESSSTASITLETKFWLLAVDQEKVHPFWWIVRKDTAVALYS